VLDAAEARELLRRRLGRDRADAEPGAVEAIVEACGRLPLALAIAAARAQQSNFPLAILAAELRETGARLDALDAGDPGAQVRAVFDCSYEALSTPAARLFRLLGLHPGPDVSVAAAAALAAVPLPEARRLLGELVQASLLSEHAPGRYVSHDLLRAYAAGLAGTHSSPAVTRLLDFYVHTAWAADRLLYPARDPIEVPLAGGTGAGTPLADHAAAMDWLAAEHRVLLAAARLAADTGHDAHAWQLAWALDTFLFRRGHWHEQIPLWTAALGAAERLGDLTALAVAHRSIGRQNIGAGHHDKARDHLARAAELYSQTGNHAGQGFVHNTLGQLSSASNDYHRALDHTAQALELYRLAGSPRGQAIALSQFGWFNDMLGNYEEAIPYCEQALALHRQVGDRRGEADVLDSLGYAHHHLGRHAEAAARYRQGIDLVHALGDQYAEAQILDHLGDTLAAAGNRPAAEKAWTAAVRILTDLDHKDAVEVRAKLSP
jgi:tetratricopeptide (TPR) repeat protein